MPDFPTFFTVAELIAALQAFPPETKVRALEPSSMSTSPLYLLIAKDGAVELIGDDQL